MCSVGERRELGWGIGAERVRAWGGDGGYATAI